MADERSSLLGTPKWRNQNIDQKSCKPQVLLISMLTDWPIKIASFISRIESLADLKCLSFFQWFYIILRMVMVIAVMITLGIISFCHDHLDDETNASLSKALVSPSVIEMAFHHLCYYVTNKVNNETEKLPITYNNSKLGLKLFGDVIILILIAIVLVLLL